MHFKGPLSRFIEVDSSIVVFKRIIDLIEFSPKYFP